jgi:hypothetical protein
MPEMGSEDRNPNGKLTYKNIIFMVNKKGTKNFYVGASKSSYTNSHRPPTDGTT